LAEHVARIGAKRVRGLVGNEYRVENKGTYGRIILKWVLANNQLDALFHVPYFPAHKTQFFFPRKM
jgi:hypothetical protein